MRFLIDAQLPPSLARWLGERGHAASAVREVGLRDSDDGSICKFAITGCWTLITKDEDFVERALVSDEAPPIVWLRIGNCTNRVPFSWIEPLLPDMIRKLEDGHHIVELRRAGRLHYGDGSLCPAHVIISEYVLESNAAAGSFVYLPATLITPPCRESACQ